MLVSLCNGLIKTGLILNETFRSFLAQGISGNKSREFPDSVPFHCPFVEKIFDLFSEKRGGGLTHSDRNR